MNTEVPDCPVSRPRWHKTQFLGDDSGWLCCPLPPVGLEATPPSSHLTHILLTESRAPQTRAPPLPGFLQGCVTLSLSALALLEEHGCLGIGPARAAPPPEP